MPALYQPARPTLGGRKGDALVDTGATIGAIEAAVVDRLQLRAIREIIVHTTGGAHHASTYSVGVRISGVDAGTIELTGVRGLVGHGLIALLGRDFLEGRTFFYDGRVGTFTLDIEGSENAADRTAEG